MSRMLNITYREVSENFHLIRDGLKLIMSLISDYLIRLVILFPILIGLYSILFEWKDIFWENEKEKEPKKRRVTCDCTQSGLQHFTAVLSGSRGVYSLRKFAVSFSHTNPKVVQLTEIYGPDVRTVISWLKFDVKIQLPAWIRFLVSERWHYRSSLIHDIAWTLKSLLIMPRVNNRRNIV